MTEQNRLAALQVRVARQQDRPVGLHAVEQRERAWTALEGLQSLERMLAVGLVGLASVWSFLSVLNARLASGRRRNPVLAAVSWPAAAWMIWYLSDRFADADRVDSIIVEISTDIGPKPSARNVAISLPRVDTDEYIEFSAPNTAPIAIRNVIG